MTNRRTQLLTLAAAAFITLLLPAAASAQQRPWWDNDRNRGDNDRRGDRHQPGRLSDAERRRLRDLARRIDDRSRSFARNLDRALDQSRYDNTRREDRINNDVRNFRRSAERFKDRAGEGNNLNRSADEARQLLTSAAQVAGYLRRVRLDSRTSADWTQLRADLRTVADIYGFQLSDLNDGYNGRDDNGRGRGNGGWRGPRN